MSTDLIDHCKSIARDIERGEWWDTEQEKFDLYGEDEPSAYDYLGDALDIEYRVGSDKKYRSAKVLVAFGGPNIWIDTGREMVVGRWWGKYAEAPYDTDAIGLDEALEELWSC